MYNALPNLKTFISPYETDTNNNNNDLGVIKLIVNPDGTITEVTQ